MIPIKVLVNVLQHIRFLAMTSQEFENGPAVCGVLTPEEISIIFSNLESSDRLSVRRMPRNFSRCRQLRGAAQTICQSDSGEIKYVIIPHPRFYSFK